jgi:phage terminase small subunit
MGRLRNGRHEKFCQLFVFGHPDHDHTADPDEPGYVHDTLHNGTRAYIAAGYDARGNAAAVAASRLIRREDVQLRIHELEEEASKIARLQSFRWIRHLPQVHALARRALAGEDIPSSTVQIMRLAVERAEGPLQFRFTDPRSGESKEGIPVFIYSEEDGQGEPPPESPDE